MRDTQPIRDGRLRDLLRQEQDAVEIPATFTKRPGAGDVRAGLSKIVWEQYGGLENVPDEPASAYFVTEENVVVIELPEPEEVER